MKRMTPAEVERLRARVEETYKRALDPAELLPDLHRLEHCATPGSEPWLFALRASSEVLLERSPWRASLTARKILSSVPGDDRAWATLGLAQTLLGYYRFAAHAYRRALEAAPQNPWYAHNLGHVLDVALNDPATAVKYLEFAYGSARDSREVAVSYAHALARIGSIAEAERILKEASAEGTTREMESLARWIKEGAPENLDKSSARPFPVRATESKPKRRRDTTTKIKDSVQASLERGLVRLPFDDSQRDKARILAADALSLALPHTPKETDARAYAAAIASAIAFVNELPLSSTEIAASFRVSAASVRGYFTELRNQLALQPADARYKGGA